MDLRSAEEQDAWDVLHCEDDAKLLDKFGELKAGFGPTFEGEI